MNNGAWDYNRTQCQFSVLEASVARFEYKYDKTLYEVANLERFEDGFISAVHWKITNIETNKEEGKWDPMGSYDS